MEDLRKKSETLSFPILLTQLYLAVSMVGLPLLAGLGGYETTGRDTFTFFTTVSVTYLAVLLLGVAELALTGSGRLSELLAPLWQINTVRICFLLYLAWSILSTVLSPHRSTVWLGTFGRHEGLCTILLCVLVFCAVSAYGKWNEQLLWILGAVVVLNAGIGLFQYVGWNPLHLFPEGTNYHDAFVIYSGQFMGTLGNVDILGAFLSLVLPIFYTTYLNTGQFLTLLPLGTGAFLLALADVDAGYVGIAATLFLTFPIYYARKGTWGRGMTAVGILAIAVGLGRMIYADRETPICLRPSSAGLLLLVGTVLIVFGVLLSSKTVEEEVPGKCWLWLVIPVGTLIGLAVLYILPVSSGTVWEVQQMLRGIFDDSFGSGRVRIWRETLRLIGERPLIGGGPDTLAERVSFTFTRYSENLGTTITAYVDSAHNIFLNTAVNQGIPALTCWLAGIVCWLVGVLRQKNDTGMILLAGVVGYLVQGCFNVSLCSVTGLFYILLALGGSDGKSKQYEEVKNRERKSKNPIIVP